MPGQSKYTRRADDNGWLAVLLSSSKQLGYLCEYTQVELTKESNGRAFFKIVDGNSDHRGKEASLKKENADKFLSSTGPNGPAIVQVSYSGEPTEEDSPFKGRLRQQWGEASFDGNKAQVTLNSIWNGSYTPIPAGTHRIMAPDTSHGNISTAGYRNATKGLRCTDVWFPIELFGTTGNSSRYIHVGHLSEGCVTFHELTKWNAIYDYLISSRVPKSSGKYVGSLIVHK